VTTVDRPDMDVKQIKVIVRPRDPLNAEAAAVNIQSYDLQHTVLHELGHAHYLWLYGDMYSDAEMEVLAERFVRWVRTTEPPPAPATFEYSVNHRWYG
jgi:hypothetical protein